MLIIWSVIGIFALIACVSIFHAQQNKKQLVETQQELEKKIEELHQRISLINKGVVGVGQRVIVNEKKLKNTLQKQEELEIHGSDSVSYQQVASLIEGGADAEQLIDQYGLPEAEAKLIELVKNPTNQNDFQRAS